MLSPYRVVDLTDNRAALGPQILAGLGAEVIKVEPPGGAPRTPEFAAYNCNKRSVSMALDSMAGRDSFRRLAASADFLFENAPPGEMASFGLGFDELRAIRPGLVYVALTPFGQDGPYAGQLATDLTLAAIGGMTAVNGDADRPPVRISVPQTWRHAAAESAVAALVAHQRRLQTGEAQIVDVSVQSATYWTRLNAMNAWAIQGREFERCGSDMQLGTITFQTIFRCRDGFLVMIANGRVLVRIVPWLVEEGLVPEAWLEDEDWVTYDRRLLSGQPLSHDWQEVTSALERYIARHDKRDLFERAAAAGFFLAPVNTLADVLSFDHLRERRFWQPLMMPDGRSVVAPGPFTHFSRPPMARKPELPAPGEANNDLQEGSPPPAGRGPAAGGGPLPFTGLKVADFSWVIVGPSTAKYLADHGATTVRVESSTRPDTLRVSGPFKDGVFGPNRSHYFGCYNTSKWSLTLNLKESAACEIARRLVSWADVMLESFTPGTMADLGLGYEAVQAINPGIIMVSTCLMGQTGPYAGLAGYGTHAAAISGFSEVTGWPDRAPGGPFAAYTDTFASRFLAASIMAALDHRRRTGEGQYIEQSQMESALHFLSPEILEYQLEGALPVRHGNESAQAAPHGIYPCLGADEWCAIAVETDEQWRALAGILGDPAWVADPILESLSGRLQHRDEIDRRISDWTRARDRYDVMAQLQAAGVPAGAVQRSRDLLTDPQLLHRHFFRTLPHAEMGDIPYEGHQFRIGGYDSGPRFAAPCVGQQNEQVLRELLGLSDEEIADLAASGALV